MGSQKKI